MYVATWSYALVVLSLQRIGLQLKATLENITCLRPWEEDFRWYLKVLVVSSIHWTTLVSPVLSFQLRCANCGEQTQKWNYVTLVVRRVTTEWHL